MYHNNAQPQMPGGARPTVTQEQENRSALQTPEEHHVNVLQQLSNNGRNVIQQQQNEQSNTHMQQSWPRQQPNPTGVGPA